MIEMKRMASKSMYFLLNYKLPSTSMCANNFIAICISLDMTINKHFHDPSHNNTSRSIKRLYIIIVGTIIRLQFK